MNVGPADNLLAARLIAASADGDPVQLDATVRDILRNPNPGGALSVLLALASAYCELARQVDPDRFRDGIADAIVRLTRTVEGGPSPA